MSFWPRFVLAVLATWRVSELIANEDGPGNVVVRIRSRFGRHLVGRLIDCFQCTSVWVAAAFAFFVTDTVSEWPVAWLALSGAACLLARTGNHEPMARVTYESEGSGHGMLR
jgi:hypothetical protein